MNKLIYEFPDYAINKNGYNNLHKLLIIHSLTKPCKSLSMEDNISLIVTIKNLRLLRDCYYIGINNLKED